GLSWTSASSGLPTPDDVFRLAVSGPVINPIDPSTLYVGTSAGLFKSTDAGASWSAANVGLPDRVSVDALAVDPVTPTTVYAGTAGSGVFKSIDSGLSWTAVNTNLTDLTVITLAISPGTPTTIFAGTE